jgi:flagellar motor switch protein FliM
MSVEAAGPAQLSIDPDVLGRFQDLMEAAVRRMRAHLINRIGADIPVRFSEVGYVALGELAEQFLEEGAGVYVKFEVTPGGHVGVLGIDGALLFRVMGLLLGEDPWSEPSIYEWRAPTRMDLMVARRIATDVFNGLIEALPSGVAGEIRIIDVSGNARLDLPLPRSALMLDVTLDFGPAEDPYGLVAMSLPVGLAASLWPDAGKPRITSSAGVNRVMPLPVTLVAELGRVKLPLGKVQALQEGEMLDLGSTRTVTLSVAGRPAFTGEAGLDEGTRCVRVLRRLRG